MTGRLSYSWRWKVVIARACRCEAAKGEAVTGAARPGRELNNVEVPVRGVVRRCDFISESDAVDDGVISC